MLFMNLESDKMKFNLHKNCNIF